MPMGACVWAPSLQLTYGLVGLWPGCVIPKSARRGRPPRARLGCHALRVQRGEGHQS